MLRFSLRTLLLGTTLCGIVLALVRGYGPFYGILLALPHVAMILGARMLIHRGRFRIAGAMVVLYLACWGATAVMGTRDTERKYVGILEARAIEKRQQTGRTDLVRFDYDPWSNSADYPFPPRFGYYCGPFFSPCPFVVNVNCGAVWNGSDGFGCEVLEFWFFGYGQIINEGTYFSM